MIVLQQHLSQKLFCNSLPPASECPSLPRPASPTCIKRGEGASRPAPHGCDEGHEEAPQGQALGLQQKRRGPGLSKSKEDRDEADEAESKEDADPNEEAEAQSEGQS